ncbi:Fe-S cluster assembly protein SufD [Candidatus Protochlamydia phocaeensis]|uniref:Fe-S cluster assembly protein SufD n=1 Tax=Candidatus Protochlamydia phocaeensis TaxID=1414722 RepID=UPI000838C59C|nr:Fe-S cluster assembly protein SufD [Candidatus Protochlamydia phocaeensis]
MMAQMGLEQELFKTLLERHLAKVKQDDALYKARLKAWQHFLDLGLPNKQTEVYRYIKLRHLFSQNYEVAEETGLTAERIAAFVQPECRQSVLVFVNGHYCPQLSQTSALPSQIVVTTLQEAARTYGAFLNNQWNRALKEEEDPFAVLNGALHPKGAFIYIPPKTVVETPIQVLHLIDFDGQLAMLMPRLQVFAGSRSQVNLVFSQYNLGEQAYFVNQAADFLIEEEAHVRYTQVLCNEHPHAWHFDAVRAQLKRSAVFKSVCVTEGSATVRTDYRVALTGENAEALLNGVWMLAEKREAHTHVFIDHQAPHCRSYQLFKGALNDFSRSSFEGKIMVRQAAQKTEAFQLNNNLILNDHAHADSKPNLEIFADDVKASHGATVGQLDPDQLFYMKTRGFPDAEAKNLLVYGFCEQVIEMIPLGSLRDAISKKAQSYLTRKSL